MMNSKYADQILKSGSKKELIYKESSKDNSITADLSSEILQAISLEEY